MTYEIRIWKEFKLIGSIYTHNKELAKIFLNKYHQSKNLYYIEIFVNGNKRMMKLNRSIYEKQRGL